MQLEDQEANTNINRSFEQPLVNELLTVNVATNQTIHLGAANKTLPPQDLGILEEKIMNFLVRNFKPKEITAAEWQVLKPAIVMSYILGTKFPKLLAVRKKLEQQIASDSSVAEIEFTCKVEAVQRLVENMKANKLNTLELAAAEVIIHHYCASTGKPLPGFESLMGSSKKKPITYDLYEACKASPYLQEFFTGQTIQAKDFLASDYANTFLAFAQPAILYGAANCDGYAALALRNILKLFCSSPQTAKLIKNICICSLNDDHAFIAINMGRDTDKKQFLVSQDLSLNSECIVIDAYHNFVLPFAKALERWKGKTNTTCQLTCLAYIDEIAKFVKTTDIKKLLKKLDECNDKKSIAKHAKELDLLSAKFGLPNKQNAIKPPAM